MTSHTIVDDALAKSKLVAFLFLWAIVACTSTSTSTSTSELDDELDDELACVDACLKFACEFGPPAGAAERCETPCVSWASEVDGQGPACVDAWASLLECVDAAPCDEYSLWLRLHELDPCSSERDLFHSACPGVIAGI